MDLITSYLDSRLQPSLSICSSYLLRCLGQLGGGQRELLQGGLDQGGLVPRLVLGRLDDVLRGLQGGHHGLVDRHVDRDQGLLDLHKASQRLEMILEDLYRQTWSGTLEVMLEMVLR